MSRIKVPCYNCEKRNPMCHAACEAYREYRRENNKRRAFLKAEKAKDSMIIETTITAVQRMKRKKQIYEHRNERKGK